MNFRPLVAILAFVLSACAGGGDMRAYPSLARRPIEAQGAAEEEGAADAGVVAPAAGVDAELAEKLRGLVAQAEQGGARFDRLFNQLSGQIRVAATAPVSSEQWVAAYQSLGRLEQARYDSVYALASLDTLYTERMKTVADNDNEAAADVEEINAVRGTVLTIVDSQNDRVDSLRAVLKQP